MLNSSRTSKQVFAVFAAAAVAVTAEAMSKDFDPTALTSEAANEAIVAAPAEITGIQAPVVGEFPSLEDARISVPELKAPVLSAPALPKLDLVVWGPRGVIPAPTTVIEVEAPDVGDLPSLEDAGSHGHGLVEPPLPTIGH